LATAVLVSVFAIRSFRAEDPLACGPLLEAKATKDGHYRMEGEHWCGATPCIYIRAPSLAAMKKIRVVELFAGVGGFRIGLERASKRFRVVWSNQWEPSTKKQEASDIYVARFGANGHSNTDIAKVDAKDIPAHDLLVGGFPCQDYSVARTLKKAQGLAGKKGVLWWEIHRILMEKQPGYVFLENVDRLLKSPVKQRGRDFAVMLASLADLGYTVEWRVVNAADYGMPQRRRRVFFFGFHRSTPMNALLNAEADAQSWLMHKGILASAFPALPARTATASFTINGDLAEITDRFNNGKGALKSPFANAGLMQERSVLTWHAEPDHDGPYAVLGDFLLPDKEVHPHFFLDEKSLAQWAYLKGAKRELRTVGSHAYHYAEGAMSFPDALDKPSRTIITGEGGMGPSRFKHVVHTKNGRLRRLTPVELERLNMFPDGHTEGASDSRRAFFMGNALVTGIVERVGKVLAKRVPK
jgi:DNA (cytosine-5)-methyltransferase 1